MVETGPISYPTTLYITCLCNKTFTTEFILSSKIADEPCLIECPWCKKISATRCMLCPSCSTVNLGFSNKIETFSALGVHSACKICVGR